jgi:hypothetical protein
MSQVSVGWIWHLRDGSRALRDKGGGTVALPSLVDHGRECSDRLLVNPRPAGACRYENTCLAAMKASAARGWRRTEPVPLGVPEQPRELLAYLHSDVSRHALAPLPRTLVSAIAEATQ